MAADSKSPECSQELRGGLEAVRRDLGFAYEVGPDDGDTLMNNGAIAKAYARDGIKVSLEFGLEPSEAGCKLVAYKMTRSAPGETTVSGTQGSVALSQCTCVAEQ